MSNTDIINAIKRLCGKVNMLGNGWCHFVYRRLHFINIPDANNSMIRISIPHIANSSDYDKEALGTAINETNREMKYIKTIVLVNGSVALNYDHRTCNEEKAFDTVVHIITTLYHGATYLLLKLQP